MYARSMERLIDGSDVEPYTSARILRDSDPPNIARYWMALLCKSGLLWPRAILPRTSRACGEPLCAKTNNACERSLGDAEPLSRTFPNRGIARSGSLFMIP